MADHALIQDWIRFLKNNRIVDMKSDPKTGRLNYRKPVTTNVLMKFLSVKTQYSNDSIIKAIQSVLDKKSPPQQRNQLPPEKQDTQQQPQQQGEISHDPQSVSDIDYRDVDRKEPGKLPAPQKPHYKLNRQTGKPERLREEISDTAPTLDEKDVEMIFDILEKSGKKEDLGQSTVAAARQSANAERAARKKPEPSPQEKQEKQEEDIRKLKHIVRDVMTPGQRKALWRALNDE